MNKIVRLAATTAASLTLIGGLAGGIAGASSGSISQTGPESDNNVTVNSHQHVSVKNNNDLSVTNNNPQDATTGNAKVKENTTGGDATSGDAMNSSSFSVSATITNSMPSLNDGGNGGSDTGSINNTGPESQNNVTFNDSSSVKVSNYNDLNVVNNNNQSAQSGNASVTENTTGGSATSGNASNTSDTSVTLNVSN